jgi:arylsulfatase A-like enzyme
LAAVLLVAGGCNAPGPGGDKPAARLVRLFDEAPRRVLELDRVQIGPQAGGSDLVLARRGTQVVDWRLGDDASSGWSRERLDRSPQPDRVTWTGRVAWDAAEVDSFEARFSGIPETEDLYTTLTWSGQKPVAGRRRTLRGELVASEPDGIRVYRFTVRRHPDWSERIDFLALHYFEKAGAEVRLMSLGGFRDLVDTEQLAAAIESGARQDLEDEVRSVKLGLPGVDFDWEVDVPGDAKLEFGYAVSGSIDGPVGFEVQLREGAAGSSQRLFAATLEGSAQAERWHDASVGLAPWAGRRVTLSFGTSSPQAIAPLRSLPVWSNPEVVPPTRKRPNIVLIVIDTLRPDRMSLYGHERATTPNIDAWARRAVVFSDVVASAPWTLPSHLSLFTGLDAYRHGTAQFLARPEQRPLAEELRRLGYATLAVTGGGVLDPSFNFDRGFDRYAYFSGSRADGDELEGSVPRALEMLEQHRDRDFFLFFHTYEVHAPFRKRQPFYDAFSNLSAPDEVRTSPAERGAAGGFLQSKPITVNGDTSPEAIEALGAMYDSGIAYTDSELARILDWLAQSGLAAGTVVALTSDHGELLGEHGVMEHGYLYEENLRVPLAIAGPGIEGGAIEQQVRLLDLFPTLMELAGAVVDHAIDGVSLTPFLRGASAAVPAEAWSYASTTNFGLSVSFAGRSKYTFNNSAWSPIFGREGWYSLGRGGERPVAPEQVEDAAFWRGRAREILERSNPGVRLRFSVPEGFRLSAKVDGLVLDPTRVKSTDIDCACVSWSDPARVEVDVSGPEGFTLNFENAEARQFGLELTLSTADGPECSLADRISVDDLAAATYLSCDDGKWLKSPEESAAGAALVLWSVGVGGPAAAPPLANADLEARLRTLGYVN